MRWILILSLLISGSSFGQWKSYIIGVKGDTLNKIDLKGKKQGPWINHIESLRGEPGYEEEGEYTNDRKEGTWRKFNLMGDLLAIENYQWGFQDGISQYFSISGNLIREESWRAFNPDKLYDTLAVEDVSNPGNYNDVIIKNEGSSLKHGTWKYYDAGFVSKTEFYHLGKLEQGSAAPPSLASDTLSVTKKMEKPKEVIEYEKKNSGKKKIKVRDGSVNFNN
jgi:hypothetical protein